MRDSVNLTLFIWIYTYKTWILFVCVSVHVFWSNQKSQGYDILALGLIWANLKYVETQFSNFSFMAFSWAFSTKSQAFVHIGLWNIIGTWNFECKQTFDQLETQAQRRAAAGRSRHKSQGEFSTRGRIFPHDARNGFSLISSF